MPFNSLVQADEDSIENLLDDMISVVADLENEYYFLKNNILSPTNDANTNYNKFLDSLTQVSIQLKNERIEIFAKIISTSVQGCKPDTMGLGPIGASQKALERANLKIKDKDF